MESTAHPATCRAEAFGFFFRTLAERAEHECAALESVVRDTWRQAYEQGFDFEQMDADEALRELDLLRTEDGGPRYADPDGTFRGGR